MIRPTALLFALIAAGGIAWWATANATSDEPGQSQSRPVSQAGPATSPAALLPAVPKSLPIPDKYDPLLKRNLFAAGRGNSPSRGKSGQANLLPEDQFVLRGVMHQSGHYTALIEDLASRQVRRVRAGDAVARGRLSDVSFDGLRYQNDGHDTRVAIGEKLSGALAVDPVVAKPSRTRPADSPDSDAAGDRKRSEEKAAS